MKLVPTANYLRHRTISNSEKRRATLLSITQAALWVLGFYAVVRYRDGNEGNEEFRAYIQCDRLVCPRFFCTSFLNRNLVAILG